MRETPFRLVYSSEAILPVEIDPPSLRIWHFNPDNNESKLRESLDLIVEKKGPSKNKAGSISTKDVQVLQQDVQ